MDCVILAAGKGTRLHPVTEHRSKAMAPVAGLPMVGRVINMMQRAGIARFILVGAPDDDGLAAYASALAREGVAVELVLQRERRGMAHALGLAAPAIQAPNFVLTACDNLVPDQHVIHLIAAHGDRQAAATLSLMPVTPERVSATGIVDLVDQRIVRIVEKPRPEEAPSNISSLPLYVLSRAVLDRLPAIQPSPRGEYELQDALQMLIADGELVTGVFTASRRQLTNCDDLLALNRAFLAEDASIHIHGSVQLGDGVTLNAPVRIDAGVTIGPRCVVGPDVYLEAGVQLGSDVCIRNTVVLENGSVPTGAIDGTIVV